LLAKILLKAGMNRHLLSHTSGITSAENEEMSAYYAAIGDQKATVLRRYFRSENETEKEEALVEIQELMQTLVRILEIPLSQFPSPNLKTQLTDTTSPSNL
jgi:hypothetical protein